MCSLLKQKATYLALLTKLEVIYNLFTTSKIKFVPKTHSSRIFLSKEILYKKKLIDWGY